MIHDEKGLAGVIHDKGLGKGARASKEGREARGLTVPRVFTTPGVHPADELVWDRRSATITGEDGKVIFEQRDIEVPKSWSMLATNVVASKYFRGTPGTPERETSVRALIKRVADTITAWGVEGHYFATEADAQTFEAELSHLLLRQKASFNSPVWFNVGVASARAPQCSACFINSVEDSMESILGLAKTEGMLFKYGSGTGTNLSPLRSSRENLVGGGTASGPVSFMKGFDAFAGVIKSGGKTRRAAKMVVLNDSHPDILDFIRCKSHEERKAWALIDAGYDASFNGEAYASVFFQNSNNSVRVTDAFMRAVEKDGSWSTKAVKDGREMDVYPAKMLYREIADAAHLCGDPGLQYHDTIQTWHTCKNTGPINASNPCSEFVFLDDTACNLASLNLMHFRSIEGEFDVRSFKAAVDLLILAQEILVGFSSYPTERITQNSHAFRPLGLGFANLGSLLMARGLAYDSDEGRQYAGAITALMSGEAYAESARIAEQMGAFSGFPQNREPMLQVIGMHRKAATALDAHAVGPELFGAAKDAWDDALSLGNEHGFRNAQVTVLAPTGTIAFMMDCDTTGIEPDIALIKYKKLVGGGLLKIVNQTVPEALQHLGYSEADQGDILSYLEKEETIEGAPRLRNEHLSVFDCAFKPAKGQRSIHWIGHIKMMAACQPFLSGAISKTVNLPNDCTPEDIEKAYMLGWKSGLKAVAVYRDGCKRTQPLNTRRDAKDSKKDLAAFAEAAAVAPRAVRRKLPEERRAITHKFSIGGHEGYLTVGMYEDGAPGEVFITMAKEGSTISGLMDSFATAISLALQYGVPVKVLVDKFSHTRFEPSGFTGNKELPIAKSITDYIFRWIALKFLPAAERPVSMDALVETAPAEPATDVAAPKSEENPSQLRLNMSPPKSSAFLNQADAPPCHTCGSIMVRSGACYKCGNCGATSGCS